MRGAIGGAIRADLKVPEETLTRPAPVSQTSNAPYWSASVAARDFAERQADPSEPWNAFGGQRRRVASRHLEKLNRLTAIVYRTRLSHRLGHRRQSEAARRQR